MLTCKLLILADLPIFASLTFMLRFWTPSFLPGLLWVGGMDGSGRLLVAHASPLGSLQPRGAGRKRISLAKKVERPRRPGVGFQDRGGTPPVRERGPIHNLAASRSQPELFVP